MVLKKIKGFTLDYKDASVKVGDITLTHDVTVLAGPNGVGKSTIIRVLAGMTSISRYEGIFRYGQDHPIFPLDISARDLLHAMSLTDTTYSKVLETELISRLQFSPYLDHDCQALSKGNQMKLNLILTLACDVPLYLLDEPFSGLDQTSKNALIRYLINSKKQVILSSHLDDIINASKIEVITL